MSFRSTELVTDIILFCKPFGSSLPGLGLCGQATADQDDEEEEMECGQGTLGEPAARQCRNDLALLRDQLHQTLRERGREGE
jgi:hypothetical protein